MLQNQQPRVLPRPRGPVWNAKQDSLRFHPWFLLLRRQSDFFNFNCVLLVVGFSLQLPIGHNESSRLAVSACAYVRAFARSGASKCKESLRSAISRMLAFFTGADTAEPCAQPHPVRGSLGLASCRERPPPQFIEGVQYDLTYELRIFLISGPFDSNSVKPTTGLPPEDTRIPDTKIPLWGRFHFGYFELEN